MKVNPMKKPSAIFLIIVAGVLAAAAGLLIFHGHLDEINSEKQVAMGQKLYLSYCASCHGAKLEGEANWMVRKESGRLPAPPHDASGHTWHHPDKHLFGIIKNGLTEYAPRGYETDMPAFKDILSDPEIWAVLAYIKSHWPDDLRQRQAEISKQNE